MIFLLSVIMISY